MRSIRVREVAQLCQEPKPMLPYETDLPPATQMQWRKLVDGVLKGGAYDKLIGKTADGLAIQPLYPRASHAGPRAFRQQPGPWAIAQRVDHPEPASANAQALADLEGGANALTLVFGTAASAHGHGLPDAGPPDATLAALTGICAGVELDLIGIRLASGRSGVAEARSFARLIEQRGLAPAGLDVDFGCDPVGALARFGQPADSAVVAALVVHVHDKGYGGTVLMADASLVHAACGSEAQELAYAIASALSGLRLLHDHGFSLDEARGKIAFLLAADADQFMTIAKFRALRRLWARVEHACGLTPKPVRLHGQTAWRMLTRRDPWVNILRTGMAVFGAGIGGADVITALPFTLPIGLPDAFARRIARNSQLVLLEEANLAKVADPAAGAGGYEALTESLCAAAWGLFQTIETAGGIVASLQDGAFQRDIAATAAQRAKAIATGKIALTGTSEFPMLDQPPVAVLMPLRARSTRDLPTQVPQRLVACRDAEPFEDCRDASDYWQTHYGTRPKIFLANLGPVASHAARAQFAANLFASGGIEALSGEAHARADGTTDLDALMQAALASKADLVCICGSDASYASEAVPLAQKLAGKVKAIYLAGRPASEFNAASVRHFIYAGCDVIASLRAAYAVLED